MTPAQALLIPGGSAPRRWTARGDVPIEAIPSKAIPGEAGPNAPGPRETNPIDTRPTELSPIENGPTPTRPVEASSAEHTTNAADRFEPPSPAWQPIVDLRQRQPWLRRLPARLGTAALWLGSISLLSPLKLAGLLALSASLLPTVLVLDGLRRQRLDTSQRSQPASPAVILPWPLARAEVADQFGVAETLLFQARHSRICTVVYDDQGRLAELLVPNPAPPPRAATPRQAVANIAWRVPLAVGAQTRTELLDSGAHRADSPPTTSNADAHLAG